MSVYTDLARKVHPDISNIPDATKKMQEVNKYKNNPSILLSLAKKWGLSLDGKNFDNSKFEKRSTEYSNRVYEAVVGAIISTTLRRSNRTINVRGVITKVRLIKRGKHTGATEYTIYNFANGTFYKYTTVRKPNIVGMADDRDIEIGVNKMKGIENNKKNIQKQKNEICRSKFDFES